MSILISSGGVEVRRSELGITAPQNVVITKTQSCHGESRFAMTVIATFGKRLRDKPLHLYSGKPADESPGKIRSAFL